MINPVSGNVWSKPSHFLGVLVNFSLGLEENPCEVGNVRGEGRRGKEGVELRQGAVDVYKFSIVCGKR